MVKIIMVSKLEFEVNEEKIKGEFNFFEAVKNGDIEIGIPEMTLVDEEGNVLLNIDDEPELMGEAINRMLKMAGAE
jgi:hypothetical protein